MSPISPNGQIGSVPLDSHLNAEVGAADRRRTRFRRQPDEPNLAEGQIGSVPLDSHLNAEGGAADRRRMIRKTAR